MTKKKVTISLDDHLVEVIDKQRGSAKRSTYINDIIEQHFKPTADADAGGGTFVTTLELRKTLKGIHDKMKMLDSVSYNVRDLEEIIYEQLFDAGSTRAEKKRGDRVTLVHRGKLPDVLATSRKMGQRAVKEVDDFIDRALGSYGSIVIDREIDAWRRIPQAAGTKLELIKELRARGLTYLRSEQKWVRM